jgi:hypothetical protein
MKLFRKLFLVSGLFLMGALVGYFIHLKISNKEKVVTALLNANSNTISYLHLKNKNLESATDFLLLGIENQVVVIKNLNYEITDSNDLKLFNQVLINYKNARICYPRKKLPEAVEVNFKVLDEYVDLQLGKISGVKINLNCAS